MNKRIQKQYYQALLDKNKDYEGTFFVGVKTTGVFCRPSCPARKPKFEHCEFFNNAQQALLANYRPCKRCQPLSHPDKESSLISQLLQAVEKHPEKRWRTRDIEALGINPSTAMRQFNKRFGMTFIAYARAKRMGIAMKSIRAGKQIIEAQLDSGYESGSGFRDAFSKIMGDAPVSAKDKQILKASWYDTELGPMLMIVDDEALYLLEFVERRGLEREIEQTRKKLQCAIVPGRTQITDQIEKELEQYFAGRLTTFKTNMRLIGTDFQKQVWHELMKIPHGETYSYLELANAVGNPKACRAVAQANGKNQLAIIIPCHRVINANGDIGGYGGGIQRKEWLLRHEQSHRIPK